MKKALYLLALLALVSACKQPSSKPDRTGKEIQIEEARGFRIYDFGDYKRIDVLQPWPDSEKTFTYILAGKTTIIPDSLEYDALVEVPVKTLVVTSTTHIPALEALGVENTLVGFPDTKYISSSKTRKNIEAGKIKELGINESVNTELLLDLQPDLVIGFSISNQNKTYETIQQSGIPVVYNGDWVEKSPLGKAEWIKFFAPFFQKEALADSIYTTIKEEYNKAKTLAGSSSRKPTLLSGSMYKDIWYVPSGESWAAQFFADANADYLWKDTTGTGSISLSFESVLEKAQDADFWIGASQFTSFEELKSSNPHYEQFNAFQNKQVYTISLTKGETGGLLYYELAPNRPDIVLKDLIHILHPAMLPDYEPYFFKPLE